MRWELEPIIAVLSVAVPLVAFVWEFAVVRRKRLGYRVQMDTKATSRAHPANAAALAQLHKNGRSLPDCVGGTLYLHGSTAMKPALAKAAARYETLCAASRARIPVGDDTFGGSGDGVRELERKGGADPGGHLAFTDGRAEAEGDRRGVPAFPHRSGGPGHSSRVRSAAVFGDRSDPEV